MSRSIHSLAGGNGHAHQIQLLNLAVPTGMRRARTCHWQISKPVIRELVATCSFRAVHFNVTVQAFGRWDAWQSGPDVTDSSQIRASASWRLFAILALVTGMNGLGRTQGRRDALDIVGFESPTASSARQMR